MENLKTKLTTLSQQPELHSVGNSGFFVKVQTVGDIEEEIKLVAGRELTTAQRLGLVLLNEQGERVFDINNEEDLKLLEKAPVSFFTQAMTKHNQINNQDFFTQADSVREVN